MSIEQKNVDGTAKRSSRDNKVIKVPNNTAFYENNRIDYDPNDEQWILNGKKVGSISSLSMKLYALVGNPAFNKTTYEIGRVLETHGYVFNKSFYEDA